MLLRSLVWAPLSWVFVTSAAATPVPLTDLSEALSPSAMLIAPPIGNATIQSQVWWDVDHYTFFWQYTAPDRPPSPGFDAIQFVFDFSWISSDDVPFVWGLIGDSAELDATGGLPDNPRGVTCQGCDVLIYAHVGPERRPITVSTSAKWYNGSLGIDGPEWLMTDGAEAYGAAPEPGSLLLLALGGAALAYRRRHHLRDREPR
jgi:hypothetical protein